VVRVCESRGRFEIFNSMTGKGFLLETRSSFHSLIMKVRRRRHRLTCFAFFTRTSDIAMKGLTEKLKNSSKLFGNRGPKASARGKLGLRDGSLARTGLLNAI
jgi:hypothetical protein